MTKKHYETIAGILLKMKQASDTKHADTMLNLTAYDFADYFAQDNPRFDREKFLTACGIVEYHAGAKYKDCALSYRDECTVCGWSK